MCSPALLTQIPFDTQLPYDRPLSDDVPLSTSGRTPASPDAPPEDQNARSGNKGARKLKGSHSERLVEGPLPSSDGLIECVPYNAPDGPDEAECSLYSTAQSDNSSEHAEPFPLVEWIREIRAQSPRRRSVLPLRWARVVSKKQQLILDSEDSWSPPLTGRPARPGSVPLHLLNTLSDRADDLARRDRDHRDDHQIHKAAVVPAIAQNPSLTDETPPRTSPSVRRDTSPAGSLDNATQYPSEWDSSPPQPLRRRLPPDSSPFRRVLSLDAHIRRPSNPAQETTRTTSQVTAQSQNDNNDLLSYLAAGEPLRDSGSWQSGAISKGNEHNSPTSPKNAKNASGLPILSQKSQATSQARAPAAASKVQVKDTPSSPKDSETPALSNAPSDLLPSSFVAATYPVAHAQTLQARPPPPAASRTIQDATTPVSPTLPEPIAPPKTFKRLRLSPARQNLEAKRLRNLRMELPAVAGQDGGMTPDENIDVNEPVSKRCRIEPSLQEPSNHHRDQEHDALDRQRLLDRRSFRRGTSTSWVDSGTDDSDSFIRHHPDRESKTGSNTASLGLPDVLNDGAELGSGSKSAIDASIRDSRAPIQRNQSASGHPDRMQNLASVSFDSALSAFRFAYPSYSGSLNSFKTATKLLLSLASAHRQPHPSLWDDFIYRMAEEYKTYLQTCILDETNALPYEEYYHVHVRKPERDKEIISRPVLHRLEEELGCRTSAETSRSLWHLHRADGARRAGPLDVAEPRHAADNTFRESARTNETVGGKIQLVTADTRSPPRSSAIQKHPESSPARLPSEQLKKRRSFPWKTGAANVIASTPEARAQSPGDLSPRPPLRSSSPSKVETWLLSGRSAGVASPELATIDLTVSAEDIEGHKPAATSNGSEPGRRRSLNAATSRKHVVGASSSTKGQAAGELARPAQEQPPSTFSLFARHYAKLPSETGAYSSSRLRRAIPINLHTW